ncbi:hypothetical protein GCM10022392_27440 [Mucilaginibacter panaciglaebae]|uniref:Uncharacterized protein n=1 Tax=Mucilaginibacter panaciglaebae TaxID=502331 RepID=A0ABP7X2Q9_9SPHI
MFLKRQKTRSENYFKIKFADTKKVLTFAVPKERGAKISEVSKAIFEIKN